MGRGVPAGREAGNGEGGDNVHLILTSQKNKVLSVFLGTGSFNTITY